MEFRCVDECSQCCIEREYYPSKKFGKIGVLILPEEKEALLQLIANNDFVLWYSAFLHVIFGSVMGLMSGFLLHDRYRNVTRIRSFW